MGHYRLKATDVIVAHQWLKNGDHPDDRCADREGQLVRYYRDPGFRGTDLHGRCGRTYHDHGWIEPKFVHGMKTWEDGAMVCPGDYIITQRVWDGGRPQYSVVSARTFEHTYEAVVDSRLVEDEPANLPYIYAESAWNKIGKEEQRSIIEATNGNGVLIMPDELLDRR